MTVPSTIKIIINGKMPRGVFARDVILFVGKKIPEESLAGKTVEFYGTTISQMSISERYTLCDQIRELGAATSLVPFDSITRRYLNRRTNMPYRPALADKDAVYLESYEFNIDSLSPQTACPHAPNNVVSVNEIEGQPIQQIVIGSGINGRLDDLRIVADILKGRKVNNNVRLMICPGSRSIYIEALKKGLIRAFMDAGAIVMNPGTVPWQVNHQGYLASGENCLTTIVSNRKGAMGSPDANIFLASPATAAASAIKGVITDPSGYIK